MCDQEASRNQSEILTSNPLARLTLEGSRRGITEGEAVIEAAAEVATTTREEEIAEVATTIREEEIGEEIEEAAEEEVSSILM